MTSLFFKNESFKNDFSWKNRFYLGNSLDLGRFFLWNPFNSHELDDLKGKTDIHKLDFKHSFEIENTFGYVLSSPVLFKKLVLCQE